MYARSTPQLQAAISAQAQLVVPESALIDSGTVGGVVLIDKGNGKYVPANGKSAGSEGDSKWRTVTVAGVQAGEKVR